MSTYGLSAFEKHVVTGFATSAGLAATLLNAWAGMPETSIQSDRSLTQLAQLGVTEERSTRAVLDKGVELGLFYPVSNGYRSTEGTHGAFRRLAFALSAVEHYQKSVHHDSTTAHIVLTKPAKPSKLEARLSELGWKTWELESTERAFEDLARSAKKRFVVMTPFLDVTGASWLRELLSVVQPGVERVLILRSLEDPARKDYPVGFDTISSWLTSEQVRVVNYSVPRLDGAGRETFHAKLIVCDRNAAYVGSTNLNSASLEHSMEMGVVLHGQAAAAASLVVEAILETAVPWNRPAE